MIRLFVYSCYKYIAYANIILISKEFSMSKTIVINKQGGVIDQINVDESI